MLFATSSTAREHSTLSHIPWLNSRSSSASRNSYLHLQVFPLLGSSLTHYPLILFPSQHSNFSEGGVRFCADGIMLQSPESISKASRAIHYVYPPTLFLCFLVFQGITVCTLENLKTSKKIIRKRLLLWLQISVIVTYVSFPSNCRRSRSLILCL